MLIRLAEASDVGSLMPLVEQYWTFDEIPGFCASGLQAPLARLLSDHRQGHGWLAVNGGNTVAYLLVVYVFSLEHFGLTAEIDEFFVTEPCRGSGLGQAMLQRAEAVAAQAGCTNLSLQVSDHNASARRFYQRAGFTGRTGYELLEKSIGAAFPAA